MNSPPIRPSLVSSPSESSPMGKGYFSNSFDKLRRDDMAAEWQGAFTLLDTVETFFDSHVDLLQRKLQKHSDRLKERAEDTFKRRRADFSGDLLVDNVDRELKNFKLKLSARMTKLNSSWESAKVIRTREKLSFFFGVMSLLLTALMVGNAPQWIHVSYTIQGLYFLPLRAYTYKKRAWHYFMFDLCYYVTILNFVYLWIFPSSVSLFTACYCLSHGALASAVITWRNSLVFHDQDKVTSLFVHIYAPLTFTVIKHFYPNGEERFPAIAKLSQEMDPWKALLLSGALHLIWQTLYWKFVMHDRREKISSGQRTTSFSFLLNDKRGGIGRALSRFPPQHRETVFMSGQLLYSVFTELPAVFVLYRSPTWSTIFLIGIFAVSVWNGAGYYIEVFGRKFERELESLRKELAEASKSSSSAGASIGSGSSSSGDEDNLSSAMAASPDAQSDSSLPIVDAATNKED